MTQQYTKVIDKAIREEYFRNFADSEYFSNPPKNITILWSESEIFEHEEHSECSELVDLYKDFITASNNGTEFKTEFMQNIITTLEYYSKVVKSYYLYGSLSDTTLEVFSILRSVEQYDTYLVGGCVRDILRLSRPKDFDFVSNMPYNELRELFESNGFSVLERGNQFLVLAVEKNGEVFEIANFRNESNYLDGRRPSIVEIGDIWTDSNRRDFTVNALYTDIKTMKLIDPTAKGINDIISNVLRFIGKPEDRIREDFLRAFRFYRFLKTKGFTPDKKSLQACRNMFEESIKKTSSERIRNELENIVGV